MKYKEINTMVECRKCGYEIHDVMPGQLFCLRCCVHCEDFELLATLTGPMTKWKPSQHVLLSRCKFCRITVTSEEDFCSKECKQLYDKM